MDSDFELDFEDIFEDESLDLNTDDEHNEILDIEDDSELEESTQISEGEHTDEERDRDSDCDSSAKVAEGIEEKVASFLRQVNQVYSASIAAWHENRKPNLKKGRIKLFIANRRKISEDGATAFRSLIFPRAGAWSASKQFAVLMRVLDFVHEASLGGSPVTKRDIYYKHVSLFGSQSVVDRLVDDIAATLSVGRADLNVRSSPKGLICGGKLTFHLGGEETINTNDSEGILIPPKEAILGYKMSRNIAWVLVVEKEAVFQTLCHMGLSNHHEMPGRGIIITGKGYPDMATRNLLRVLADSLPSVPILALVDGDSYGLDILSVYKYGSVAMRHEEEKMSVGRLKWIGIWASELDRLEIDEYAMIPITEHDRRKTLSMLGRPNQVMPNKWRRLLTQMLHTGLKVELEILGGPDVLLKYLVRKIGDACELAKLET